MLRSLDPFPTATIFEKYHWNSTEISTVLQFRNWVQFRAECQIPVWKTYTALSSSLGPSLATLFTPKKSLIALFLRRMGCGQLPRSSKGQNITIWRYLIVALLRYFRSFLNFACTCKCNSQHRYSLTLLAFNHVSQNGSNITNSAKNKYLYSIAQQKQLFRSIFRTSRNKMLPQVHPYSGSIILLWLADFKTRL